MSKLILTLLLSVCTLSFLNAQQKVPNESTLTVEQIMQGEKFVGYLPERIHWSDDSKHIYFSWNPDGDTLRSIYRVGTSGGTPVKLDTEALRNKPSRFGSYNKARTKKLYNKSGDIYMLDINKGTSVQISNTIESESNPQFSGDEQWVIFRKGNNLFAWHTETGSIRQLSNFVSGSEKKELTQKENEAWLERDQLEYFEILRQRKETEEAEERRDELLKADRPTAIYLKGMRISSLQASPDLKYITYRLTKNAKSKGTKVPSYVSESGYIDDLRSRSKVGTPQNTYKMGIYDVAKDSAFTIDPKQLPGIYDKPAFLKDYHKGETPFEDQYKKPREVIMHGPIWSDDGKALVVVRSLDNKDRWVCLLDPSDRKLKVLDRQRDEAWVGGPGISSWNFTTGNVGWLADNVTIYLQSEESGYSHLYLINTRTGNKKALTTGDYEIRSAQLSHDKQYFYINANKVSPHEQHFYRLSA
ncbi:MAG: DPP IV N-terminal domain-containing protein, partial [Bacteroidota bacterium]